MKAKDFCLTIFFFLFAQWIEKAIHQTELVRERTDQSSRYSQNSPWHRRPVQPSNKCILFSRVWKQIFTHSLRSFVKSFLYHSALSCNVRPAAILNWAERVTQRKLGNSGKLRSLTRQDFLAIVRENLLQLSSLRKPSQRHSLVQQ